MQCPSCAEPGKFEACSNQPGVSEATRTNKEEIMSRKTTTSRRELLLQVLPACSLCLGCTGIAGIAAAADQKPQALSLTKRAAAKSDMTYEEVFKFAYGGIIPVMKNLSDQAGKDKFLEMLKKAASDAAVRETEETFRKQPKRELATYLADLKKPSPLYQHALTYEIVKDTEKEAELKVTECLWAKTFREAYAGDVGYAMICHADIAGIKAFNPKITLTRPKLLMQGDDECRFRWTMGA
jgi:hypothetical protein